MNIMIIYSFSNFSQVVLCEFENSCSYKRFLIWLQLEILLMSMIMSSLKGINENRDSLFDANI